MQTEARRIETTKPLRKLDMSGTSVNEFGSGVFSISLSPETLDKEALPLYSKGLAAARVSFCTISDNSDSSNCEAPSVCTPVLSLACGIAPLPPSDCQCEADDRSKVIASASQLQQLGA
jgi:hypothetical protein